MTSEGPSADVPSLGTVVFVSMSRGIGGPARSLLTVLQHLDPRIDRVLYCPVGDLVQVAGRDNTITAHVEMPFDEQHRRRSRLRAALALVRYVRAHRSRVLAVHANGQTDLNLNVWVLLLTRVPIVMWAHASHESPTAGVLGWLWRRTRRVRWLAVSQTARRTLADTLGLDASRIEIVPNPIDPADVVADHVDGEDIRVAYLGLAAIHKGFDLLGAIIDAVGRDDVGFDLYVAPPPASLPAELHRAWKSLQEAGRAREVTLQGRTIDVRRAYALCDIVLCPSRHESFGRIAAEAMANGLPVVASDVPAFRDLVGETGAGLLFDLDHPASAAAAIERLADDPALRHQMGERGREHVERFGVDAVVGQLEAAYRGARP